jgi:outer membrane protein TolC
MSSSSTRPVPRVWRAVPVAAAGLLLIATSAALAQPSLTLDRALQLAQERSRLLPAQESAAAGARQMALAASHLPDPVLKAGVNNLPVDGADRFSLTRDFMTMRSIGVMQEFTRDDKRKARSARFHREAEAAEAGRMVALIDLRRETAMAWLERHFQERLRGLLQVQRSETALQIDAAEAAYRGGRGSQADVFAARLALAQIDDRIRQADLQVATAKTTLARWVGTSAEQPLGEMPVLSAVRLETIDLEVRLEQHPQLALMARQEATARAEADIARSNRQPDMSVELMVSQRGSAFSNMVSVNVSIPLQWDRANRQDRELAAKLAESEQLRAQREEATREQVARTRTLLLQWTSTRNRLAHYDSTLIPLATDQGRAAIAAYRGGSAPLAAALDARRTEIDRRVERLQLEMEAASLWARLEYLIPAEHSAPAAHAADAAKEQRP